MRVFWQEGEYRKELLSLTGTSLWVATAYLGREGVELLQAMAARSGLTPEQVHVFLGDEFSESCPDQLLMDLCQWASVYVVMGGNTKLHAKVILIEGAQPALFLGSVNLTRSGLARNLEFAAVEQPNQESLAATRDFFDHCKKGGLPVTDQVIDVYRRRYSEEGRPSASRAHNGVSDELLQLWNATWSTIHADRPDEGSPVPAVLNLKNVVGQIMTEEKMGKVTGVRQRRATLRLALQNKKRPGLYKAALLVTWMGSPGDKVDPPDEQHGRNIYLNANRMKGHHDQLLEHLMECPREFPLWVFHHVAIHEYRCLGVAEILGRGYRNNAPRWIMELLSPYAEETEARQ